MTKKKMRKLRERLVELEVFAATHLQHDHGYVVNSHGILVPPPASVPRDQPLTAVSDNG